MMNSTFTDYDVYHFPCFGQDIKAIWDMWLDAYYKMVQGAKTEAVNVEAYQFWTLHAIQHHFQNGCYMIFLEPCCGSYENADDLFNAIIQIIENINIIHDSTFIQLSSNDTLKGVMTFSLDHKKLSIKYSCWFQYGVDDINYLYHHNIY